VSYAKENTLMSGHAHARGQHHPEPEKRDQRQRVIGRIGEERVARALKGPEEMFFGSIRTIAKYGRLLVVETRPKRFSAKKKLEVLRKLWAGESASTLAAKYGVDEAKILTWRDTAQAAAARALKKGERRELERENSKLKRIIGELVLHSTREVA
jgi:hypothetical protein